MTVDDPTLRITEIFLSLQGESNTVGLPTVFIRLTGCPLRCNYCDTAYAFSGGANWTIDDILREVKAYDTPYVTVTGGEPLAQKHCIDLLDNLAVKRYQVSLETSGALDVTQVNKQVVIVMDLKTPSSGEESKNIFQNLDYLEAKDQVKFVIGNMQDYRWAKNIMERYKIAERCQVLFSPSHGVLDPTTLADNILKDRLAVRFQIQLHKLLWNDEPGR